MSDIIELGLASETSEVFALIGPRTIELGIAMQLEESLGLLTVVDPEVVLTVLTPVLNQAPGSIEVTVSGGNPLQMVTIAIDGTDVSTVELDTDGNWGPFSVPVDSTLGTAGAHSLTAGMAEASFTILQDPTPTPVVPTPDDDPLDLNPVIAGVRHWVFQDLVSGGLGSWVLPYNPKPTETSSPFPVKQFTSRRSTASSGSWHVFQGQTPPKEWNFGGYLPREEHVERLMQFRNLNRRFYIIDHRNRAWICVLTNVEIVPRLRHTWVARGDEPLVTDWGTDYRATAMILDPNWVTPV